MFCDVITGYLLPADTNEQLNLNETVTFHVI